MMNKLPLKFETIEGHIQNIECLVDKESISNLEIKTEKGYLMTITFPMALPFERDDRIKAYIDMRKYNGDSSVPIGYKDKLSNKEEAFKIEKIKHWKVVAAYRISTKNVI